MINRLGMSGFAGYQPAFKGGTINLHQKDGKPIGTPYYLDEEQTVNVFRETQDYIKDMNLKGKNVAVAEFGSEKGFISIFKQIDRVVLKVFDDNSFLRVTDARAETDKEKAAFAELMEAVESRK